MERTVLVGQTYSVCPACLRRLRARRVRRADGIYLERDCPEHGRFSSLVWRGLCDFKEWMEGAERIGSGGNENCPNDCGLCGHHIRDTCCVLLEVASACDLRSCRFCFADQRDGKPEPTQGEIKGWIEKLVRPGKTFLQLSGGEPATRGDLPEIVKIAAAAGCKYIQLNTNGLRLADDEAFVRELADAGLSFVFMQFDGTDDDVYMDLRGRPLFEAKKRAIENCSRHGIGVTLVPTLVRGVNTDRIGDIVRFAVSKSPAVRGVHFQPVCYMGRFAKTPGGTPPAGRYTLDELMCRISEQAGDLLNGAQLRPSCCDHPMCGFHGDFVVLEDGTLHNLNKLNKPSKLNKLGKPDCCPDPAEANREFVGRRWLRNATGRTHLTKLATPGTPDTPNTPNTPDITDMDYFLERARSHAFTISAMAFQDAGNLDLERLRSCSLHVFRDGKMIPFCANYLTPQQYSDER